MITIHYDFTDGTEVSFIEGKELGDAFTTNCLNFFNFDNDVEVIVLKKDGSKISSLKLLENTGLYTEKNIRIVHNIEGMLISGAFNFEKTK